MDLLIYLIEDILYNLIYDLSQGKNIIIQQRIKLLKILIIMISKESPSKFCINPEVINNNEYFNQIFNLCLEKIKNKLINDTNTYQNIINYQKFGVGWVKTQLEQYDYISQDVTRNNIDNFLNTGIGQSTIGITKKSNREKTNILDFLQILSNISEIRIKNEQDNSLNNEKYINNFSLD